MDIVKKYMKEIGEQGGSIINLKTGGGKTVLALYIISLLKKKTIILVHKSFLMDQWQDRILEFLPNVKITKVQGTKSDWSGDIVIAMIQTVLNREIPEDITNELGFLVADECHHLLCNNCEVIIKIKSKISSRFISNSKKSRRFR